MHNRDVFVDLIVESAEELAARISLAKKQFVKQDVTVKVEHLRELQYLHSRCTEFRRCVEELEEAQELHQEYNYAAAELAWNQSMDAADVLLRALS
jgi:hypothetical protein